MPIITLTTDFGAQDWFAGAMKGSILSINPHAHIVDITHCVSPGDIRAGAFSLAASCRFFPEGTIHVAVVDPGVGGGRKAIAVRTPAQFFVGPDNGVLSAALRDQKIEAVHRLENPKYLLSFVSRTFHGRDVFAPVAAHLSLGLPIRKLGPAQADWVRLPFPAIDSGRDRIDGEVVYIDRFGNGITNIPNPASPKQWQGASLRN